MALRLLVAHSDAEKQAARDVEARVFLEAFDNTPEVLEQEYGRYADRSAFVTVIDDRDGVAVGAARLVLPDASGEVKTLTDVAGAPWRLPVADSLRTAGLAGRPVVDVATLAVDPRHRRGIAGAEITLALCHGLYRWSLGHHAEGLVTILDDRVLRSCGCSACRWSRCPGRRRSTTWGRPPAPRASARWPASRRSSGGADPTSRRPCWTASSARSPSTRPTSCRTAAGPSRTLTGPRPLVAPGNRRATADDARGTGWWTPRRPRCRSARGD